MFSFVERHLALLVYSVFQHVHSSDITKIYFFYPQSTTLQISLHCILYKHQIIISYIKKINVTPIIQRFVVVKRVLDLGGAGPSLVTEPDFSLFHQMF